MGAGASSLAAIARYLLRSEAIASSRIEGITPSPQQIAIAEIADQESIRGVSTQAQLVANNITVVGRASAELVQAERVTVEHIVGLHDRLLPNDRHRGLRTMQNWIGGSQYSPVGAAFVPPPPDQLPALMDDLVDFINGAAHTPLVQAALVHAQFETIHPFTDGNGRVGRALIHTVLTRRGLTPTAVLPVSLVLVTVSDRYINGLTGFRYIGSSESAAAQDGVRNWIDLFVDSTLVATRLAGDLKDRIAELRVDWTNRLSAQRVELGIRPTPRFGSTTARLLDMLPEAPVVTARTLQGILDISHPAASAALDELVEADILRSKTIGRNSRAYLADELLDLVATSERQLASTKFGTAAAPPHPGVPAGPD
ncbi:MAG: Fic family protein [Nakamurella sp.]